jgi:hypothetical protein
MIELVRYGMILLVHEAMVVRVAVIDEICFFAAIVADILDESRPSGLLLLV